MSHPSRRLSASCIQAPWGSWGDHSESPASGRVKPQSQPRDHKYGAQAKRALVRGPPAMLGIRGRTHSRKASQRRGLPLPEV